MTNIADGSACIQTSSESVPATPSWFGEAVLLTAHLRKHGILSKISEGVRFARRRFGRYEVLDFLVVLFGCAISGERTLEAFYKQLQPFAIPYMAMFERDQLPARSTLSRLLAVLADLASFAFVTPTGCATSCGGNLGIEPAAAFTIGCAVGCGWGRQRRLYPRGTPLPEAGRGSSVPALVRGEMLHAMTSKDIPDA